MDRITSFLGGKGRASALLFFVGLRGLGFRSQAFKTKDSQARFRFVKFFRVAEMSHSVTFISQSNNKI